jgi:hypothetical protein
VKTFHCTHCQSLVFFENVTCLTCGNALAYLPDQQSIVALRQATDGSWQATTAGHDDPAYRLCANYSGGICNWASLATEPEALCPSCRLTRVIPNLSKPENHGAWAKLEAAKRRMIYTLLGLGLEPRPQGVEPRTGLAFEFLEDSTQGDASRVLTGHDNGVITVNIAEADDVEREKQRTMQHEPYRTLLGHFRHEIGHYYWDRLVAETEHLTQFRELFGDERADYQQALQKHYNDGPPPNWEQDYISAYATMHPWEDWAESWAHLLHMVDALETASAAGLSLKPKRPDEPSMRPPPDPLHTRHERFDQMVAAWLPLTYILNNLNRGLGLPDSYPFVLSAAVIAKLRFVHQVVTERAS